MFRQGHILLIKVSRHLNANVAIMPGFPEKSRDVDSLKGVALGESITMRVFQQPYAFAGLVEVSMKFNVFLADDLRQFGRAEVDNSAELVLAETRRRAQDIHPIWLLFRPFLAGDGLGGITAIAGDNHRLAIGGKVADGGRGRAGLWDSVPPQRAVVGYAGLSGIPATR